MVHCSVKPPTGESHAKKHHACPRSALGFLGFDGFAMESATLPRPKSLDVLWTQGWVSCGRCLVYWPPLWSYAP
eukprot:9429589-Pyramimonas_sp.AAC.1